MLYLFYLLLAVLGALAPLVQACAFPPFSVANHLTTSAIHSTNSSTLPKRFFRLPKMPVPRPEWTAEQIKNDPMLFPWPANCIGERPLRYCWKNKQSYRNLHNILYPAIGRWAHAMEVSSMRIDLDPACELREDCICDDIRETSLDACEIQDTSGDADNTDGGSWSSLGWNYTGDSKERTGCFLNFGYLKPLDGVAHQEMAVLVMAHELGHIMGLDHEHQRPDRDEYLIFNPQNVPGYKKMKEDINNNYDLDEETYQSTLKRLQGSCYDNRDACNFFESALQYIKADGFFDANDFPDAFYTRMVSSKAFDFDSIMIYGSSEANPSEPDRRKWVFRRKIGGGPIFEGGNPDPKYAGITKLDMEGITEMYPLEGEEGPADPPEPPSNPNRKVIPQIRIKQRPQHIKRADYDPKTPLHMKIRDVWEGTVYPPGWRFKAGQRQPGPANLQSGWAPQS